MATENKQQSPSARERLLARAREQYADRTFADIGAEPQEGVADLDEAINEMLEGYINRQSEYDEKNSRLAQLLGSDPAAAEFMQRWIETGDPRTALVEQFGEELGMAEEARANFKNQLEGWRERKAANDALEAEAEANWQASLKALDDWGDTKGLSMEEKADVMGRLLAIVSGGIVNTYTVEDFDMAYNAINHDRDVNAARVEGEVAGRNAKIAAARRERSASGSMPPATGGKQGGVMQEPKPKKRSFWEDVNNG